MRTAFGAFVRLVLLACLWLGSSASASAYDPYGMAEAAAGCAQDSAKNAALVMPNRPIEIRMPCTLRIWPNQTGFYRGDYMYVYCIHEYHGQPYAYWSCQALYFLFGSWTSAPLNFGSKKICPTCEKLDTGTGNRRETQPLFGGGGPDALGLNATYNSAPPPSAGHAQVGSMGLGWTHSFQRHVS